MSVCPWEKGCVCGRLTATDTLFWPDIRTCGHNLIVVYIVDNIEALPYGEVVLFYVCCSINFKVRENNIKNC